MCVFSNFFSIYGLFWFFSSKMYGLYRFVLFWPPWMCIYPVSPLILILIYLFLFSFSSWFTCFSSHSHHNLLVSPLIIILIKLVSPLILILILMNLQITDQLVYFRLFQNFLKLFRSDVWNFQSIFGKLKTPIIIEFVSVDSNNLHNSSVFSSLELGGL